MRVKASIRRVVASTLLMLFPLCSVGTQTAHAQCNQWHAFGENGQVGVPSLVRAVAVYDGDLYVAGDFTHVAGQLVNHIARWDGSEWHPLTAGGQIGVGNGMFSTNVHALIVYNGELIVGGDFFTAGGQMVHHIARWNGATWQPLVAGGQIGLSDIVWSFAIYNNELVVGGNFNIAGGQFANRIVRWDSTSWHPFVQNGINGLDGTPLAMLVYQGELIVGGAIGSGGGQTLNRIARWNGDWHPFIDAGHNGLPSFVQSLAVYQNDLIVGGAFTTAGGQPVNRIARWNGSWAPFISNGQVGVSGGDLPYVQELLVVNDDLIVAGGFLSAGGQTVNYIARWDSVSWHPYVFNGQIGVNDEVVALAIYSSNIVAGGIFTTAGGVTVNRIAHWGCKIDPPTPGDITGDGVVNVSDLLAVINAWGACPQPCPPSLPKCPADTNVDCLVNVLDLLTVINNWG